MREAVCSAPLTSGFFDRNTETVARDLLGKILISRVDGMEAGGRIVETEAYLGSDDPGSHAATKGITSRNAPMYGEPGTVYVYLTYGVHHMVNLVCEAEGVAGAVLVRAIEPLVGVDVMTRRRTNRPVSEIANGPGKVAAALGVDLDDNGTRLGSGRLTVCDSSALQPEEVVTSGRIGLSSGHDLPLRFYVAGSANVSKGRPGPVRRRAGDRDRMGRQGRQGRS